MARHYKNKAFSGLLEGARVCVGMATIALVTPSKSSARILLAPPSPPNFSTTPATEPSSAKIQYITRNLALVQ